MAGTQYINIIYINYLSLILIAHSTMGNLQEICCTSMDKQNQTKNNDHVPVKRAKRTKSARTSGKESPKKAMDQQCPNNHNSQVFTESSDNVKNQYQIQFSDFEIQAELGKGGFGVVYLGQLKSLKAQGKTQKYAIKCVYKQLLIKKNAVQRAVDQKNIAMLSNQFTVPLIMSFQDEYRIYLVLEYAMGGNTFQLICDDSPKFNDYVLLGENAVRFIAACVILGMEFVHKNGYMYRDLKPENVLLTHDGYVKLTDFGLAEKVQQGKHLKNVKGTPLYYAPEMVLRKGYNKNIDFWTLGVYLYQMSNYVPPFNAKQICIDRFKEACLREQFKRTWANPNTSPQLKDLINNLLRFDPSSRIGVNDWNQIKNHQFFNGFNWQALEKHEIQSPLKKLVHKYIQTPKNIKSVKTVPQRNSYMKSASKIDGWTYVRKNTGDM